jgi:hypothetical protein
MGKPVGRPTPDNATPNLIAKENRYLIYKVNYETKEVQPLVVYRETRI